MEQGTFRSAALADKARILEIAAQAWEGDDYIPDVIDDWLDSATGRLIVAVVDGRVVGLARHDRTLPGYAWFEGLRIDAAYHNRGIAKATTGYLIEMALAEQVERMGLSTYYDNYASQRVSATYGFTRVVGFAACSGRTRDSRPHAELSPRVETVSVQEAIDFVAGSDALAAGKGFLPHSWRFYPFAREPRLALAQMEHRLGIRVNGKLAALLLVGNHAPHGSKSFSLDFLEGDPFALADLARHALALVTIEESVEAILPCRDGAALPTLEILEQVGLEPWNEGRADVLVFERPGG